MCACGVWLKEKETRVALTIEEAVSGDEEKGVGVAMVTTMT